MFSFLCLLLCLIRMERVWMWRVHVTNVLKHCSIHLFLVLMLILFLMYKIIFSHLKLPLSFVYFGVQQQFICLTLVDCENDSKVSSLTSVVSQSECDARWRHFTVLWISTHPSHLLFLFITSYVTCLVLSFFSVFSSTCWDVVVLQSNVTERANCSWSVAETSNEYLFYPVFN